MKKHNAANTATFIGGINDDLFAHFLTFLFPKFFVTTRILIREATAIITNGFEFFLFHRI